MKKEEKILKALANRRRLEIVKYLKGRKEASVSDISEKIQLSFKAISKHLAVLYSAEILDKEQKNIYVYYYISANIPQLAKNILTMIN